MKYIAVDSGKFATKAAIYDEKTKEIKTLQFRTKVGPGSLNDDMLPKNTSVIQVSGVPSDVGADAYRVGNGAAQGAEMESSKKTRTHFLSTWAAVARLADDGDEICLAAGEPYAECMAADVTARHAYRDYLSCGGKVDLDCLLSGDGAPKHKSFSIHGNVIICPESAGPVYMDVEKYVNRTVAVVDIGNKNTNGTLWENTEINGAKSFTNENGGEMLIAGLAQELTAQLGMNVGEQVLGRVLRLPPEKRMLIPNNGDKAVQDKSKEVIDRYLMDFAANVKRSCDIKGWETGFIDLVFIGGTSSLLKHEIRQTFGESVVVPDNPEYVNVKGFLRRLCGFHGIDIKEGAN